MKQTFLKAQLRLLCYVVILAAAGAFASRVGAPHGRLIKAAIGITAACTITHHRLLPAFESAFESFDAITPRRN